MKAEGFQSYLENSQLLPIGNNNFLENDAALAGYYSFICNSWDYHAYKFKVNQMFVI